MSKSNTADQIIWSCAAGATGAAIVPIPVADVVMISGIQIGMIIGISNVYDRPITKDTAKGLLGVYGAALVGQWIASLVKFVPVLGSVGGGIAQMVIAGTITYSLGLAFKSLCEKNKEFTEENLRREKTAADKEAKTKSSEFIELAKASKKYKNEVNFRVNNDSIGNKVIFNFNISRFGEAVVRVTDEEAKYIFNEKANHPINELKWEPKALAPGTYYAFLDINGLAPYSMELVKN